MKEPIRNFIEKEKDLIDAQDYLSESQKKKAKEEIEKAEKTGKIKKEEQERNYNTSDKLAAGKNQILFDERDFKTEEKELDELDFNEIYEYENDPVKTNENNLFFLKNKDREERNGYPGFGKSFLEILEKEKAAEQAWYNKKNDLPGYRPEEKKYAFENVYGTKQGLSDLMSRRLGVSQEKLDKIDKEADKKFGKDIFSEAVDSGIVNIGANVIGGGELLLDKVVGWENNPLTKANERIQKRAAEEEKEVMEAVERTGKGSLAEFSANVIVAITESLPDLALALMTGGGSTATKAVTKIGKIWKSTAANPNFWYAAETQLYPIYREALADGATEDEALRTALGGAPLSAGLEGNLGFEKYIKTKVPMTWKQGFLNYAKAGALEGVEEAVKNAAPEVVEKWVFDPYKPLLKAREGEEAVLNLSEAGMDFLIGGAGGLVSSTPRLFDISLDAYGDKISRKNKDVSQEFLNYSEEKRE